MRMFSRLMLGIVCLMLACCGGSGDQTSAPVNEQPQPEEPEKLIAKYLPADDQVLFIVGQDMEAVAGYVESEAFPTPGGVTTYMNLYHLREESRVYAGLGIDNALEPTDADADWWGSGRHNAWKSATNYPHSSLAIGLDITEQYETNGLSRIIAGEFDAQIDKLAAFIKKVEQPIFLRIGYEFDGTWNRGYQNTQNYIGAWHRIVDRIRAAGANNVAFVWQASTSPADDAIEGVFESDLSIWYPGDDYVDWMGYSWFLLPDEHGTNAAAPSTQTQLTDQLLEFARLRNKPVLAAEAAPQGYFIEKKINANIGGVIDGPSGENVVPKTSEEIWSEWFAPFFAYVRQNKDIIRGVAYINVYWDQQPKWAPPYNEGLWGDSRVQVDAYITGQWQEVLADSMWLHGGPSLFDNLQQ